MFIKRNIDLSKVRLGVEVISLDDIQFGFKMHNFKLLKIRYAHYCGTQRVTVTNILLNTLNYTIDMLGITILHN